MVLATNLALRRGAPAHPRTATATSEPSCTRDGHAQSVAHRRRRQATAAGSVGVEGPDATGSAADPQHPRQLLAQRAHREPPRITNRTEGDGRLIGGHLRGGVAASNVAVLEPGCKGGNAVVVG